VGAVISNASRYDARDCAVIDRAYSAWQGTCTHTGMFTLLSEESVSAIPGREALYVSLTIHVCALIVLTWLSLTRVPSLRLELRTVHAGTTVPVRAPEPLFAPVRNLTTTMPAQARSNASRVAAGDQTKEEKPASIAPTTVPSEFLRLLEADRNPQPVLGAALSGPALGSIATLHEVTPPPLLPPSAPPEPPPGEPDIKPPVVVGGRVEPAELIKQTQPVYPMVARTARVEGTVVLEGTVNVEGRVENLQVVSGHPMLVDAARDTVRKWKYRPAKLNGRLIPCPVTVQVRFILQYPGE